MPGHVFFENTNESVLRISQTTRTDRLSDPIIDAHLSKYYTTCLILCHQNICGYYWWQKLSCNMNAFIIEIQLFNLVLSFSFFYDLSRNSEIHRNFLNCILWLHRFHMNWSNTYVYPLISVSFISRHFSICYYLFFFR